MTLKGRKVQDRYEKLEKAFEGSYLNPGTNGSDKGALTPLQPILKDSAMKKATCISDRGESAEKKAAKAKYLGQVERQFHMRAPSPGSADKNCNAYDSNEEEAEILRQAGRVKETGGEAPPKKKARASSVGKGRVSSVGGEETFPGPRYSDGAAENARAAEKDAADEKERDDIHKEILALLRAR